MDERQIQIMEGIVGALLVVSFMNSIFETMINMGFTLSAVLATNSIYDVMIRYVIVGMLAYLFKNTKKLEYLPFPIVWGSWVFSTIIIALPPLAYSIMGIFCFILGFVYLMKVIK